MVCGTWHWLCVRLIMVIYKPARECLSFGGLFETPVIELPSKIHFIRPWNSCPSEYTNPCSVEQNGVSSLSRLFKRLVSRARPCTLKTPRSDLTRKWSHGARPISGSDWTGIWVKLTRNLSQKCLSDSDSGSVWPGFLVGLNQKWVWHQGTLPEFSECVPWYEVMWPKLMLLSLIRGSRGCRTKGRMKNFFLGGGWENAGVADRFWSHSWRSVWGPLKGLETFFMSPLPPPPPPESAGARETLGEPAFSWGI